MIPIHVHGPQKDSPYENGRDLKNGQRPQKWTMTAEMDNDLKNRRQPQKWKMTSKMEDDLKNGR